MGLACGVWLEGCELNIVLGCMSLVKRVPFATDEFGEGRGIRRRLSCRGSPAFVGLTSATIH